MRLSPCWFVAGLGVCVGVLACGGHGGGTSPTPVPDAPSIACPAAPDPVDSLDGSAQVVSFPAPTVTAGQPPLSTSCTPVSGSSFPVGTTTVICTTSDAKARTATCSFPVVVQPPPKLPVSSFLAFGDSLTWGEDGSNGALALAGQHIFVQLPSGQRYPDMLQQELQDRYKTQSPTVTVFNAGCRGESLSDPGEFVGCAGQRMDDPSAYRRFTSLASTRQWDAVLFMEGSNDVDMAAGDSRVLPVAIGYLRQMVDAAKGSGMRVVLGTIPPMVPPGAFDRAKGAAVVPVYNGMIKDLAASEGVPLADVYAAFGSDAPSLIGFDGLHPNPDGYKRIADTFFAEIKSALETRTTSARVSRVR